MKDSKQNDDKVSQSKLSIDKSDSQKFEKQREKKTKKAKSYVKRQYKKEKRLAKLRYRAKKDKALHRILIRVFFFISCLLLIVISVVALSHLNKIYKDSEEWKKSSPTKISSIPTDILYMNSKDRTQYLKYYDLYDKVWDENKNDFKKDATDQNMKNLDKAYHDIDKPMDKVKNSYNNVRRMWQIKSDYNRLVSHKKINKDVSPNKVKSFITKNADYIVADLVKPGNHKFAKYMRTNMINLSSDLNKVDALLSSFNPNFKVEDNKIKVSDSALPGDKIKPENYIKNMYYDWSHIKNQVNMIMNEASPILDKHDKDLARYKNYLDDKNDESNFKSFKQSYNDAKKKLNAEIIKMPDLKGKTQFEAEEWANENNVTIHITYEESEDEEDMILDQTPDRSQYKKMLSSATLEITVSKKPEKKEKEDNKPEKDSNKDSDKEANNESNNESNNDSDDDSNKSDNKPKDNSDNESNNESNNDSHNSSNKESNDNSDNDSNNNSNKESNNDSNNKSNSNNDSNRINRSNRDDTSSNNSSQLNN